MSDKRDPKDKIVVLWTNPYDDQKGTDMYKSLAIDASVTSKTVKSILEGKSNFRIDTFHQNRHIPGYCQLCRYALFYAALHTNANLVKTGDEILL